MDAIKTQYYESLSIERKADIEPIKEEAERLYKEAFRLRASIVIGLKNFSLLRDDFNLYIGSCNKLAHKAGLYSELYDLNANINGGPFFLYEPEPDSKKQTSFMSKVKSYISNIWPH